jgi:hypothetical protein
VFAALDKVSAESIAKVSYQNPPLVKSEFTDTRNLLTGC